MRAPSSLQFKLATEEWEFDAIHRLNYRTFVEEIPQHAPNPEARLVDRFHAENTYVIARQGRDLVGMLALRGKRPFSLDNKLNDLDSHLPPDCHPVEVRLLAVEPVFRRTSVFVALFEFATRFCLDEGYDVAVISGTTRQLKLYHHLGFRPFGSLVGSAEARYQPMYLTLAALTETSERSPALRDTLEEAKATSPIINLLPGPVMTTPTVDAAFRSPALSHRSPRFLSMMASVRESLCRLTQAREVQIIPGSGSLANAIIAAQLSLREIPGLIVTNGAFGERLAEDARRAQLRFELLSLPWGHAIPDDVLEAAAARLPRDGWIWCVHHETSSGVLNSLEQLTRVAHRQGLRLCLDGISSIGSTPVDLRGVHLASASSGKGLGGYPGLALVFHDFTPKSQPNRLPGYLDLGHWAEHGSVPHTHSSNLLQALSVALGEVTPERMESIRTHTRWLHEALSEQGWELSPDTSAPPSGVITLKVKPNRPILALGEELESRGYLLNFRSSHLASKNWIQISLLGNPPHSVLEGLVRCLADFAPQSHGSSAINSHRSKEIVR
ncbi:MAG TPA: aminotransferase class V-fold PLP-dependent enzyme [Opitutaceae bacterium]|nr:aminotransferase class V-fold PLP-dependent enzyme [Opitutaceae bacterium]